MCNPYGRRNGYIGVGARRGYFTNTKSSLLTHLNKGSINLGTFIFLALIYLGGYLSWRMFISLAVKSGADKVKKLKRFACWGSVTMATLVVSLIILTSMMIKEWNYMWAYALFAGQTSYIMGGLLCGAIAISDITEKD